MKRQRCGVIPCARGDRLVGNKLVIAVGLSLEICQIRRVVILLCVERRTVEQRGGMIGRDVGQALDRFDAVLAQNALHPANGISLTVKQPPDAAQQINVIGTIIAATAAPLHRFDLVEACFPEPQNVLRHIKVISNFADRPKRVRRFVQVQAPR